VELLASGEPEEIEHLSDEELDDRTPAQRRPLAERLRTVAPFVAVLVVGAVLGGVATSWWRDREQRVQAASTADLALTFQHAEQDFDPADPGSAVRAFVLVYLDLENRSPGPVRVESLRPLPSSGVERAHVRAWRPRDLAPGQRTRVRVDVSPVCGHDPDRSLPGLRLAVTPERGGVRDLDVRPADTPLRYTEAAMGACEWLSPPDPDAGLSMAVASAELGGRGRTAELVLQMLVLPVGDRPLVEGGSVTGAELTLPGVRVVQPTMPVPLAGAESTTELVFGLTMDSCAEASGPERGELRVTVTAGDRVATLDAYGENPDLERQVLRYVLDVCR
jgi:hypothetical protein